MAKRRLGRGLDALLGASTRPAAPSGDAVASEPSPPALDGEVLARVPVDQIQRGRYQPRRDMRPEALEELAASIRAQGVMQPVVIRPIGPHQYELIAGERRWRATQMAGLHDIPAVIRNVPDEQALALALIENIQREDLNPVEEALALQRLIEEFELTQQQVADAVGKSRVAVTNLLRLLALSSEVRTLLERGDLEMGHARALLSLEPGDQRSLAQAIVNEGLTVRQAEARVRALQQGNGRRPTGRKPDPDTARLEQQLGEMIGAPVRIEQMASGKGKLVIRYSSLDELEGILAHLK